MIILEGPDNAGKSTLGKKLSRELDLPLIHSTRPDPDWNAGEVLLHSMNQLQPQQAILDRVYSISEYVYGNVIRGKTALGRYHSQALLDLYNRPHLVIYCRPDDHIILNNQDREQMEGVLEYHQALIDKYDQFMEELGTFSQGRVIKYNWKRDPFNRLVDQCTEHMKRLSSQVASASFLAQSGEKQ